MSEIYHSEKLNLNYKKKYDDNGNLVIVFEDNVNYRNHEMKKIKNFSPAGLRRIHQVKHLFNGVIV